MRRTVPDPDTSWRPTLEQERQARLGYQLLDESEHLLFERVRKALRFCGYDIAHLGIEVDGDRIILRGAVRDALALHQIPECVRQVDGVAGVIDQLVIA